MVEMVSGPDLGGGYLHQLTVDRAGAEARFVHHVQEGGMDAAGPPLGDPAPFGFVQSEGMCPFGGRRCWHREYIVAGSEANRVRMAYNRWRFVADPILREHYREAPRPVAQAVRDLLEFVAPTLDAERVPWYIGGSAGAWVRGVDLLPGDIDLGTTAAGARRLADLLEPYLIEPYARTEWPGSGPCQGARAFLGTRTEGMRVEWSMASDPARLKGSLREWAVEREGFAVQSIDWNGLRVPVSPIDYTLVRCAERGRWERVDLLLARIRESEWDRARIERLLSDGTLDMESAARVRKALRH